MFLTYSLVLQNPASESNSTDVLTFLVSCYTEGTSVLNAEKQKSWFSLGDKKTRFTEALRNLE